MLELGIIDAIVSVGSLIIPPAFDFIKKKFVKSSDDTPERTIGTLATTKPEVLPEFVKANSTYLEAKTKYFNRDVIGDASQWVVDLRASIRPITVVICLLFFGLEGAGIFIIIDGTRYFMESCIGSWFGSRLSK